MKKQVYSVFPNQLSISYLIKSIKQDSVIDNATQEVRRLYSNGMMENRVKSYSILGLKDVGFTSFTRTVGINSVHSPQLNVLIFKILILLLQVHLLNL